MDDEIEKTAFNIVNQLYDLAETPVEKRQAINDTADQFVSQFLKDIAAKAKQEERGRILEGLPIIDNRLSRQTRNGFAACRRQVEELINPKNT